MISLKYERLCNVFYQSEERISTSDFVQENLIRPMKTLTYLIKMIKFYDR